MKRINERRGIAMAAALVEFAVASAILFGVLQSLLSQHRQLLTERHQLQAQWLAQAGVDRAIAQLQGQSDYHGEMWQIPADELASQGAGEVQIQVQAVPDKPDDRQLMVQAKYPSDSVYCSQQTREVTVHTK